MSRPGHRGGHHDQGCQLCFAELAVTVVAGFRLGERCLARLTEIAADAARPIEREVSSQLNGGVQCRECGAVLEVDEERLTLACPNGHAVALIPSPDATVSRARPAVRVCSRCQQVVERRPGQRGATPAMHPTCRTPEELAALAAQRAISAEYYATHKSQWSDYADRKRGRRSSPPAPPRVSPPVLPQQSSE